MNLSKYAAVIQAGGEGKRMASLTHNEIPKPLLRINNKPLIEWQIEDISRFGIKKFVIILGHLGYLIKEYFGKGEDLGVSIEYIEENEPLGSAGALFYLKEKNIYSNYIFIFCDVMIRIDWNRVFMFHENKQAVVTLLAHPNSHPYDSDLLILDSDSEVIGIDSKDNKRDYWYENCVNAGIYIFKKELLDSISMLQKCDFEKDILAPLLGKRLVFGYITSEYVKDVGTPDRFVDAVYEQSSGVWETKCLTNPQKCVFLDRDGTINKFKGLIYKEEDFELEDYVCEAIKRINQSGFLAIVVTNQPAVARGLCSIEDINNIHKKMVTLLGNGGAYLDDIIFCPHHPDRGFPGENTTYKISCKCRKPGTGMIEIMTQKHNIDISNSYIIGDSSLDIQTGINIGLKTILLKTGVAGNDGKYQVRPDFIEDNLLTAVNLILGV